MMNSRKSWINYPLLKNIIKNNLYPAKVSLLIFVGTFALALMAGPDNFISNISVLVFGASAIILTTIYPCFLQSYLVDKTKSAMMKTLPLTTKCVWFTHYLAGYLIAAITLFVEGIGVIILKGWNYSGSSLSDGTMRFMLAIFMLLFVYYTLAYLVCCMSGNRLGQVIFSLVAYAIPVVILGGFIYITPYLVPSSDTGIASNLVYAIFPLGAGVDFIYSGNCYIILHVMMTWGLLWLSYYIYGHRDDGYIGEPLVFHQMIIALKAFLVIIIAICGFGILLLIVDMKINYGLLGIMIMLLIYVLIGCIGAIIIEVIFKEKHMYRNLLIYIPILIIVFGLNYFVANQRYLETVDFSGTLEAVLDLGGETDNYFTLNSETTKAFQKYLSTHRNLISCNRYNDESLATLNIYTVNDRKTFSVDYQITNQAVIDYFKTAGKSSFKQLFNDYQGLEKEAYLTCYVDDTTIYIKNEQIKELIPLINNQIAPEEISTAKLITILGQSNQEYSIVASDEIEAFLTSPKLLDQAQFIESCQSIFSNIINDDNKVYSEKLNAAFKEKMNTDNINCYLDTEYPLVDFNSERVTFLADYQVINGLGETSTYPVKFIIEKVDDKPILTDIEIGGSKHD